MSLLHSFYCWGSVGVVLLSSLFFTAFGISSWRILACVWALIPLYNIYNFATCPIEYLTEDGKGMTIGQLFREPLFWVAILLMVCAGASEMSMAQWASAYTEAALGFSKSIGDLIGPCLFAVTMGVSRVIYGKYGAKINLNRYMIASGILDRIPASERTMFLIEHGYPIVISETDPSGKETSRTAYNMENRAPLPEYTLDSIARYVYEAMKRDLSTPEGKAKFEEWKKQQAEKKKQ